MRLTKVERETVRMRFGGLCAYCGTPLGDRWQADHLEPVYRWAPGQMGRPERDCIENLMPSCQPCNNYKHNSTLEGFRQQLQRACGVLTRDQTTYRHAVRFGLVVETGVPVIFHFERAQSLGVKDGGGNV